MKPMTDKHLATLRRHMVEIVELHYDLSEDDLGHGTLPAALRGALLAVPRHLFVPAQLAAAAYQDSPLPIAFDKTMSQPFIGAVMIDLLGLEPGHRVLEVGTGLGYQAAVMAEMGAQVFSVEVVEELAEGSLQRFAALGLDVAVRVGDGSRGWDEHAPFDRILVTAAAARPPAALLAQLAPDGRMVIPLGPRDVQQLSVMEEGGITPILPVRFTRLEIG